MIMRLEESDIDRWARRLWAISQDDRMVIDLGGHIQDIADEMRDLAGLPAFEWNTILDVDDLPSHGIAVRMPDSEAGE